MKAFSPEEVDTVVSKLRVYSSGKMTKWQEMCELYTEDSMTIDYDGQPYLGLDGILEAWSKWATRKRFTHGWSERVFMLGDDIAIKFYQYPNRGADDNGEPWDFMANGFWVGRKLEDGSWRVLIDVPWARMTEVVGTVAMATPWDTLLEPLSGDTRVSDDSTAITPLEASRG